MTIRTPINTNANSKTARTARTSSLASQSQNAARKYALGTIYAQLNEKSHRLHGGRGCFKPGTLIKIVEDLKGGFTWII